MIKKNNFTNLIKLDLNDIVPAYVYVEVGGSGEGAAGDSNPPGHLRGDLNPTILPIINSNKDRRTSVSNKEITDECHRLGLDSYQTAAEAFKLGVRFAERFHKITK